LLCEELVSNGYAADDGVALHFIGDRLHQIVSSRPTAKAYFLKRKNDKIEETLLDSQYLGKSMVRTKLSSYDSVVIEARVVRMRFNQSRIKIELINKSF
jgi:hypothetical protein